MTRSYTQATFHNTVIQLLAKVVSMAASLVLLKVAAGFLGPSGYGDYTLIVTLLALALNAADFGSGQIAVKFMTAAGAPIGTIAAQATLLRLSCALVVGGIAAILVAITPLSPAIKIGFYLGIGSLIAYALQAGFQPVLQVQLRSYVIGIADAVAKAIAATLLAVTVYAVGRHVVTLDQQHGVYAIILLGTVVTSVITALWVVFSSGYVHVLRQLGSVAWPKRMFRESLSIWLVTLLGVIHYRADVLLLSQYATSIDVGIYSFAYRFLDVAITFPALFVMTIYPLFMAHVEQDRERFYRVVQKSFTFLGIAAVPMVLALYVFAPVIVSIFGGPDYAASVGVLRILSFAVLASYLNAIFAPVIIAHGGQAKIIYVSLFGVACNIGLNVLLIPTYGYIGSAIATVCSEVAGCLIIAGLAYKAYGVTIHLAPLMKALALGVVAFVALSQLPSGPVQYVSVILAIMVYGVIVVWANILDRDMLAEALSFKKR